MYIQYLAVAVALEVIIWAYASLPFSFPRLRDNVLYDLWWLVRPTMPFLALFSLVVFVLHGRSDWWIDAANLASAIIVYWLSRNWGKRKRRRREKLLAKVKRFRGRLQVEPFPSPV